MIAVRTFNISIYCDGNVIDLHQLTVVSLDRAIGARRGSGLSLGPRGVMDILSITMDIPSHQNLSSTYLCNRPVFGRDLEEPAAGHDGPELASDLTPSPCSSCCSGA